MIFVSCGGAPHGSGCGGRRAADFAPRTPMAPVRCLGRAMAAAWAPGGERRELWVCGKIWPEIWSPSDYGAHAIRAAIHIRVISAVQPSWHACRQHSTSLRAMANLVRAPNPVLHERTLTASVMQVFVDTCVSETVAMQSCDFGDGRAGHMQSRRLI